MNQQSEQLETEIKERKNRIALLLRQSALMRNVSKGFNTAEQKRLAINISEELSGEAKDEQDKIDQILEELTPVAK